MTDSFWGASNGSWFTGSNWFPFFEVPTASDDVIIDYSNFGHEVVAQILNGTAVAKTVTIDASNELQIGSGGILNATDAITVDGDDALLVVQDGGAVGIATSSVLNIGGTTEDDNASGELILAGSGAIIGPSTVALNGGASEVDFEMTASYTFANDITGIGQVVQSGPASVTLTDDNTYSGGTLIDAGTLQIGSGGTSGSLGSGAVTDNGTLAFDLSQGIAIFNVISGSGGVSFSGGGEFELAATNSYGGTTTIAAGTRLDVDAGGTTGTLGTGAVTDNGVLAFDRADTVTVANDISGSGAVLQFTGTLFLTGDNTYTGATFVESGALKAAAIKALSANSAVTVESGATLDLNGFDESIGALSGAGTVDNSAPSVAVELDDNTTLNSTFSGVIKNTGGELTLVKDGPGTLTLAGANTYSGGTAVEAGTLAVENASTTSAVGVLGSGIVAVDSGAALLFDNDDQVNNGYVIDDAISGGGVVDFAGANDAVTTLNEASSFTGGSSIISGIVDLSNNAALGSGTVTMFNGAIRADHGGKTIGNNFTLLGTTVGLGAFTDLTGAITILNDVSVTPSENAGNSTWSGAVSLGPFTLATGNVGPNTDGGSWTGQSLTISGAISGIGGVTQASSGTLVLSGANTYSGQTTVTSGTLKVLNASTTAAVGVLGSGGVAIASGANLLIDNADQTNDGYKVANLISGAGSLTLAGPADSITTMDQTNTFTGGTAIESGIVNVENNSGFGSGPVTMTGGALRATDAPATIANKFTLSGTIGLGAATNITGAITLAGNTTVTPSENAGSSTWSGAVSLDDFTLATGDTGPNTDGGSWSGQALTISGAISGAGAITQDSAGELALTGQNSYSGATTIEEGALAIGNAQSLGGSGALAFAGSGALDGDFTGTETIATTVETNVNASIAAASGDSFTLAGALTQVAGSTLALGAGVTLSAAGTSSLAGKISGAGALTFNGGSSAINSGATLTQAKWTLSGSGTAITLGENLGYSGTFSEAAGVTLDLAGGSLTLTGSDTFAGGTIDGSNRLYAQGTTLITDGLTIGGTASLENQKTLTQSGGAVTVGDNAGNKAELYNASTGTYAIADDSGIGRGSSTASFIVNSGLFEKTGGTATSAIAASFTDTGTVTVASGTLSFSGPSNSFAGAITGAGTVLFAGGGTSLKSGASASVATLSETGAGTTLTIAENLSYGGIFTEGAGSTLVVDSGDTLTLTGTTTLAGTTSGAGALQLSGGGSTTIDSGAKISVSAWSLLGSKTSATLKENLGYSGTFSEATDDTLDLAVGYLTLTGADTFAGGTLDGSNRLYAQGTTLITDGLTIGGTASLENQKTVTQSGGAVTVGDNAGNKAELYNASTGTYAITDNSGIDRGSSTASFIVNAGMFEKTGGTATSAIAPALTNTGTVLVSSGVLDLQGAVSGTGADTISGASTLEFDAAVAAGQTIGFTGSGGDLHLDALQSFSATISGFDVGGAGGTSDAIQLLGNWAEEGFSENGANTLATLTLSNGTTTSALQFAGKYSQSQFTLSQQGGVTTIG